MSPTRSRVLAGDRPNTAPPAPREAPLPRSEVRKEADRACPHPRPARVSVWGRRLRRRADPPRRRGAQAGATQRQGHVRAQGVRWACRGPPPPPRQARTVRRACGRRAARERATGCGKRNVGRADVLPAQAGPGPAACVRGRRAQARDRARRGARPDRGTAWGESTLMRSHAPEPPLQHTPPASRLPSGPGSDAGLPGFPAAMPRLPPSGSRGLGAW